MGILHHLSVTALCSLLKPFYPYSLCKVIYVFDRLCKRHIFLIKIFYVKLCPVCIQQSFNIPCKILLKENLYHSNKSLDVNLSRNMIYYNAVNKITRIGMKRFVDVNWTVDGQLLTRVFFNKSSNVLSTVQNLRIMLCYILRKNS